jgi:hypothetical protein
MKAKSLSSVFDPRRFALLLRRDVAHGYRSTLIAMASVAGVIVLVSLLTTLASRVGGTSVHLSFFGGILFIGGFIYTSLVFREIHSGPAATLFLTLPSTPLEKFASKAVLTSVGYALGALAFCTAVSALAEGLDWLVFRAHNALFNPFDRDVLMLVAVYLVTQAVFLLGSVAFRKLAFLKTAGMVSLIGTVVSIVAVVIGWAMLHNYFSVTPGSPSSYQLDPAVSAVFEGLTRGTIPVPVALTVAFRTAQVLFWAGLAPACWAIGYFKMREKEV